MVQFVYRLLRIGFDAVGDDEVACKGAIVGDGDGGVYLFGGFGGIVDVEFIQQLEVTRQQFFALVTAAQSVSRYFFYAIEGDRVVHLAPILMYGGGYGVGTVAF